MINDINLPDTSQADRTPLVNSLLRIINQQQETIVRLEELVEQKKTEIAHLKNHKSRPQIKPIEELVEQKKTEIAHLKNHKSRPQIKPSKMETEKKDSDEDSASKGSSEEKKSGSKKQRLTIHKEKIIKADGVPEGSLFKGYSGIHCAGTEDRAC